MCDCESVKGGFNAAGLSVQSAPEQRLRLSCLSRAGFQSKAEEGLQGGREKRGKKSFEEQDCVDFLFFFTPSSTGSGGSKQKVKKRVASFMSVGHVGHCAPVPLLVKATGPPPHLLTLPHPRWPST